MTTSCLNDHILNIKCKHAALGIRLADALTAGSKKTVCLDRYNVATARLVDIISCYKTFTSDVTYAYKITFTRAAAGSSTINVTLKDNALAAYTGTGTAEEIAIYFQNLIDAGGLTVDYKTERIGAELYVYSYDSAASFSDTTTVTVSNTFVTYKAVSLQTSLSDILNLWNTLTEEEICSIITMATTFADKGIAPSPTNSSSGCNC